MWEETKGNHGMEPTNYEENQDGKMESRPLLYPQTYPHMNVPAIADDLVHIGRLHLPRLVQQIPKLIDRLHCHFR